MGKKTIDPAKAAEIAAKQAAKEDGTKDTKPKATPAESSQAGPDPDPSAKEGKLARIRRLRAEGFTRKQILEDHTDADGQPFHPITVAIQSANVERKKLKELGDAATDEDRVKWSAPKREKPVKEKPVAVEGEAKADKPKRSRAKKDSTPVTEGAQTTPAPGVKIATIPPDEEPQA